MPAYKIKVFRARKGMLRRRQWWWKIIAANGQTVGNSAEGYNNKGHAETMANSLKLRLGEATVEVDQ